MESEPQARRFVSLLMDPWASRSGGLCLRERTANCGFMPIAIAVATGFDGTMKLSPHQIFVAVLTAFVAVMIAPIVAFIFITAF